MFGKKKERFKRKNGKVPYSIAPTFFKEHFEVKNVMENGIFIYEDNTSDKVYEVIEESVVDSNLEFEILRSYDVNFKIHILNNKKYLTLEFSEDKNFIDLDAVITRLETDMFAKLKSSGIVLKTINFEERMEIAHTFFVDGRINGTMNVMNYHDNVESWKEDFELQKTDTSSEKQIVLENGKIIKMFFIRKLDENINEVLESIKNIPDVNVIKIEAEAIKDQAVGAFFRANYMGYEVEMNKLKKEDPALWNVYAGDALDEDKRQFSSCGAYFILKADEEEKLQKDEKILNEISQKFNCEIEAIYGPEKAFYSGLIPFVKGRFKASRLYRNDKAKEFFNFEKVSIVEETVPDSEFIWEDVYEDTFETKEVEERESFLNYMIQG